MASGALQQMLMQTDWPELDILVIDMPPGTGDIQLTLAQRVPVDGALIVTTPQDIALLRSARKGIEMFRKVRVPVYGIIENMSTFVCPHCGENSAIFGEGGGDRIAEEFAVPVLARVPLSLETRETSDAGRPIANDGDSGVGKIFKALAADVSSLLANQTAPAAPMISIVDD